MPVPFCSQVANHAAEALQKSSDLDVEDLCIVVYYWFDKSAKVFSKNFVNFVTVNIGK